MSELGSRVQAARKAAGLSQQKLAERLPAHVTRNTIAALESGRKQTGDIYEVSAIAKALGCSIFYLVPDLGIEPDREAFKAGYDQAVADMRAWAGGNDSLRGGS